MPPSSQTHPKGNRLSPRMAIGSIGIKKRYGFSDEDITEEIRENP